MYGKGNDTAFGLPIFNIDARLISVNSIQPWGYGASNGEGVQICRHVKVYVMFVFDQRYFRWPASSSVSWLRIIPLQYCGEKYFRITYVLPNEAEVILLRPNVKYISRSV